MPRRRSKWEIFGDIAGGAGQAMLQYWLAQQERKQERDMLDARLQSLLDLEDRKSANQLLLAQQDPKLLMQENLIRALYPEIYGGGGRPGEGTPEEVIARLDNPGLAALQAQDPIMGIGHPPVDELFAVEQTSDDPLLAAIDQAELFGGGIAPDATIPGATLDMLDVGPFAEGPLRVPPQTDRAPQPDDGTPSQFHPACERWQAAKMIAQVNGIDMAESPPGIDCSANTPEYDRWYNRTVVLPQVSAEVEAREQGDVVREVVELPDGTRVATFTRQGDLVSQAPDSAPPPSLPGGAPPIGEPSQPRGVRLGDTTQKKGRADDYRDLVVQMTPLKGFIGDLEKLLPKLWAEGRSPWERGVDCLKFNATRSIPAITDVAVGLIPGGDTGLNTDVTEFVRVREGWAAELAKLGGDTGRLSNQDIERAQFLLPRCNSTPEDAKNAIGTMKRAIEIKELAALQGINEMNPFALAEGNVTAYDQEKNRMINSDSDPIESRTLKPIGDDGYPRGAPTMATGAGGRLDP